MKPSPDPGDVGTIALPGEDDCDVRFPAETIGVSGGGSTVRARPSAGHGLLRRTLSSYASSYLSLGNAALVEYANNGDPVRETNLEALIHRSGSCARGVPTSTLPRAIPERRPPATEDFIYLGAVLAHERAEPEPLHRGRPTTGSNIDPGRVQSPCQPLLRGVPGSDGIRKTAGTPTCSVSTGLERTSARAVSAGSSACS
jgi:hypothetical protein